MSALRRGRTGGGAPPPAPPGDRGVGSAVLAAAALVALTSGACGRSPDADSLRVGLGYDFASLDPHLTNTNAAVEQLSNVYEPLVALDPDLRVVPCLATSWSSPDPLTWVFRLRPAVRFHDGSPFSAEDVVHSLTRLQGDETLEVRSFLAGVAAVSAAADGTVHIRTSRPRALLLNSLSFVPIVPRGATGKTLEAAANGTGPYRVESWTPRRELRLSRNDGYWGRRPPIRAVTVELGLTDQATREGVTAGRFGLLRAGFGAIEEEARKDPRYRSVLSANIFLRYLGFDVSSEAVRACPGMPNPFRLREVREAIGLAIDRGAVAARVGPEAVPAFQIVPAAVFGHDPRRTAERHDVEKARRLLAGAGFPGGFPVVLYRPSGFAGAAEAVAAELGRVGLTVRVESLPSADFFDALRRKELGFWIAANGCASGDALEVLWDSFHSNDAARGAGVDNYAGFRDPEVDLGIDEAAAILEPPRRLPLLQKLLARVLEERVWIPLYHNKDLTIVERTFVLRPRADLLLRYAEIAHDPSRGR